MFDKPTYFFPPSLKLSLWFHKIYDRIEKGKKRRKYERISKIYKKF